MAVVSYDQARRPRETRKVTFERLYVADDVDVRGSSSQPKRDIEKRDMSNRRTDSDEPFYLAAVARSSSVGWYAAI